jgi:hypothetical protein
LVDFTPDFTWEEISNGRRNDFDPSQFFVRKEAPEKELEKGSFSSLLG